MVRACLAREYDWSSSAFKKVSTRPVVISPSV
jgi:hypothetical protein